VNAPLQATAETRLSCFSPVECVYATSAANRTERQPYGAVIAAKRRFSAARTRAAALSEHESTTLSMRQGRDRWDEHHCSLTDRAQLAPRCRRIHSLIYQRLPQLTAFFNECADPASSATVNSFRAKATGHTVLRPRFACR